MGDIASNKGEKFFRWKLKIPIPVPVLELDPIFRKFWNWNQNQKFRRKCRNFQFRKFFLFLNNNSRLKRCHLSPGVKKKKKKKLPVSRERLQSHF